MSEKNNSTLSVMLLIVGLVLGGGGGYFFANSTFQPQVETLEDQITVFNAEITVVTAQIADVGTQVEDITEEVSGLETEKTEKTAEYNSVQSELESTQAVFDEAVNRKNELEALVTPMEGCFKVNLFGFSFDCPTDVTLEAAGASGESFGDSLAVFAATDSNEQYEIDVSWISLPYVEGIVETYLEDGVGAIADYYDISLTGLQNTTISGCPAKYITWSGVFEEYTSGIVLVFYCDTNNKLYIIEYDSVDTLDLEVCYAIFNSVRVS